LEGGGTIFTVNKINELAVENVRCQSRPHRRFGEGGAETWEVVDPAQDDLAGFDAFVWHDSTTGLNHRTENAAEAMAFNAAQAEILDAIEAAEQAARVERRISDESGAFGVWIVDENGSSMPDAGGGGPPSS